MGATFELYSLSRVLLHHARSTFVRSNQLSTRSNFFTKSTLHYQSIMHCYATKPKTFYLRIVVPGVLTLRIVVLAIYTQIVGIDFVELISWTVDLVGVDLAKVDLACYPQGFHGTRHEPIIPQFLPIILLRISRKKCWLFSTISHSSDNCELITIHDNINDEYTANWLTVHSTYKRKKLIRTYRQQLSDLCGLALLLVTLQSAHPYMEPRSATFMEPRSATFNSGSTRVLYQSTFPVFHWVNQNEQSCNCFSAIRVSDRCGQQKLCAQQRSIYMHAKTKV